MEEIEAVAEEGTEVAVAPDLSAVIRELRRPFMPEAVKFKIQTNPRERDGKLTQALVVAFMDSRLAAERLNAVCPGEWSDYYRPGVIENSIVCAIKIGEATREDAGYVDIDRLNSDMGLKGLYSDAFKRAAVKFGIGAFLYALPRMYVKPDQLKRTSKSWFLTSQVERDLRERYGRWLMSEGIKRFGAPLDHGDPEDGQGDPDAVLEPDEAEHVAETAPSPDDMSPEQRDRLRQAAERAGWPLDFIGGVLDEFQIEANDDVKVRIDRLRSQQVEVLIARLMQVAREQAKEATA